MPSREFSINMLLNAYIVPDLPKIPQKQPPCGIKLAQIMPQNQPARSRAVRPGHTAAGEVEGQGGAADRHGSQSALRGADRSTRHGAAEQGHAVGGDLDFAPGADAFLEEFGLALEV